MTKFAHSGIKKPEKKKEKLIIKEYKPEIIMRGAGTQDKWRTWAEMNQWLENLLYKQEYARAIEFLICLACQMTDYVDIDLIDKLRKEYRGSESENQPSLSNLERSPITFYDKEKNETNFLIAGYKEKDQQIKSLSFSKNSAMKQRMVGKHFFEYSTYHKLRGQIWFAITNHGRKEFALTQEIKEITNDLKTAFNFTNCNEIIEIVEKEMVDHEQNFSHKIEYKRPFQWQWISSDPTKWDFEFLTSEPFQLLELYSNRVAVLTDKKIKQYYLTHIVGLLQKGIWSICYKDRKQKIKQWYIVKFKEPERFGCFLKIPSILRHAERILERIEYHSFNIQKDLISAISQLENVFNQVSTELIIKIVPYVLSTRQKTPKDNFFL